jgi:transposase
MGDRARRHKVEIMKREEFITDIAGVDIGKLKLDVAFARSADHQTIANRPEAFAALIAWLHEHGVHRVGMEASGDYERDVREALEVAGFEVVVHQPQEIKAYARFRRVLAKSDKIDARVIAQATQHWEGVVARRDPVLAELAEMLTLYEFMSRKAAETKTLAEHQRLAEVKALNTETIRHLMQQKQKILVKVLQRLRARPDLRQRFELLQSLPGIGPVIAAVLVVRMPELGSLQHGQAAALLGVAPFDRDSGMMAGKRFIKGGRQRPRDFVYLAALAAKRWKSHFKIFADRLIANGKLPKVAIIAVMRKLIEAANLILKRQSPWIENKT